tara:strand:+ start:4618 stop:6726 length:2109 start_codon:yes stop_codon:yes gene_type:complete
MDIQDLETALKQGNIPAWATEETLAKVAKALNVKGGIGDLSKTIGKTGDTSPKTFIGGLNAASSSTRKLSKSADIANKAFSSIQSVTSGAAGIVGALAQSKGSFSDLNPIIDTVADGMGELAGAIPIVGGFFKALIGFSAEIAKLNNVVLDDLIDNFMALSKSGLGLSFDLQTIQLRALEAGVGFETLTSAVLNNFAGMIAFGGSVENATKRFAASLDFLTNPNNPEGFAYAMQSLGYGSEQAAEFLGQFIEQNRNSLRLQGLSDKEVAGVAFEYAKSLQVLSELTGVQVDEIRANQLAQVTDGAFQAKLQQMRNANMAEEADATQKFAGTMRGLSPVVEKGFKDVTAGLMTQQTALLLRTVPGLEEAFLARDAEAVRNLLAGLAKDGDALEIGTLGLLDASNPLSQLINDLLPAAQRLLGIVTAGPTQEELENQQQIQMDRMTQSNINFESFNDNLVFAGKQLDIAGKSIQAAVIEKLIPAMEAQLALTAEALSKLTSFIKDPSSIFETGDGLGFFDFDLKPNDPNNEPVNLLDLLLNRNTKPKFGGGSAGQGLYVVGERGPELLALEQGSMGHVYNNGQMKSMLGKRENGGPVQGMPSMAMLDYLTSEGIEGSRKYDDGFEIAYTNTLNMPKIDEATMKEFIKYQNSKKNLKFSDTPQMEDIISDVEFKGNGGAVVGEIRNLNKMLKSYMGKITSGSSYF